MHLLGFKDKEMATDILVSIENQTFFPMTSHEELQQLALQPNAVDCVYLQSSQKQVYELEESHVYTIAHCTPAQQTMYTNVKKEDVIHFIKQHLEDYEQNNIAIYVANDCLPFTDF